ERERDPVTVVHHRSYPLAGEQLPFCHPGLRLEKCFFELFVPVEPCLCLSRDPGDTDKVARTGTSPPHKVRPVHKTKAGRHDRELIVVVDVTADDRSAEFFTAVLCPLHDAGELLPLGKPHRDEHVLRGCAHARNIADGDRGAHPADLPVGHAVHKIGCLMEHIGRCYHHLVPAREHGAVIVAVLLADDRHYSLQEFPVVHVQLPPFRTSLPRSLLYSLNMCSIRLDSFSCKNCACSSCQRARADSTRSLGARPCMPRTCTPVSVAESRGIPASRNSAWICGSPSPAAGVIRARILMSARSLTTLRPQPPVRCTNTISPSPIPVSSVSRRSPSLVRASSTLTGSASPSMEISANVRIRSTRFASVRPWRSSFLSRFF